MSRLQEQGISSSLLRTTQPFHSRALDGILERFESQAASTQFRAPAIPLISNVTGAIMDFTPGAGYWAKQMRGCVRFADGADALTRVGVDAAIEIGPGETLLRLLRDRCAPETLLLPSIRRDDRGRALLESAGRLYTAGASLEWRALLGQDAPCFHPEIPGQPFQRARHWFSLNGEPDDAKTNDDTRTYSLDWVETTVDETARAASGDWVIVGDGALADGLIARLRSGGARVHHVSERPAPRSLRLAPARRDAVLSTCLPAQRDRSDYEKAVQRIAAQLSAPADRCVFIHLRGLECKTADRTTPASIESDERLYGPADVTHLTQAVLRAGLVARIWIVTSNSELIPADAAAGGESRARLSGSTLWGFGRTLFLEHPELRGGLIDVDGAAPISDQTSAIVSQIGAGAEMTVVRNNIGYAPRLTPAPLATAGAVLKLRTDASYLVTGGLGGLGLACARRLAERGAGRIVLMGRRGLPSRDQWDGLDGGDAAKAAQIRAIEELGARVEIVAMDIRDHDAVTALIGRLNQEREGLRGVIHAAGVNWFGKIAALDTDRLRESSRIKTSAAWNLHQATLQCDLDMFVLFSSVSALWGSVDLSHYTAANHFLDALAWERRRMGLKSCCIAWGPWADVGMSAPSRESDILTQLGFRLTPPAEALDLMEATIIAERPWSLIADIDWPRFETFIRFSLCPSLFARIDPAAGAATLSGLTADRIRSADPRDAMETITRAVQDQLARVLLLEPGKELDVHERFNLMGMDSLVAIQFALHLEGIAGVKLPTTLAYNHPTVFDVATHLYEQIRGAPSNTPPGSGESGGSSGGDRAESHAGALDKWFPFEIDESEKPRLYCIPYAGAGASVFSSWRRGLAGCAHVVPVQLPGREERADEPPVADLALLASRLVDAIAAAPPAPFALFGHSQGALIAYEATRELRRRGLPLPVGLFLSGCGAPDGEPRKAIRHLDPVKFRAELRDRFPNLQAASQNDQIWDALAPTLRADIEMLETYRPDEEPPFDLPIAAFGGRNDPLVARAELTAWAAHTTGDFGLRIFAGDHLFLNTSPIEIWKEIAASLANIAPALMEMTG